MPSATDSAGLSPAPISVSELNRQIRESLEGRFSQVLVTGEISGYRTPTSGHLYFTLKDDKGQISGVMFRGSARSLRFQPQDGMEVIVWGRVGLYDARGTLQIYVERMEPSGVGSAQLALEQLKQRLADAGLFAAERKRPLPMLPSRIGIVTALGGAALQDMLVVLQKRMPSLRILIRPVRVQGKEAPQEIADALDDLAEDASSEVIIVGRGGGSTEDLNAFNDERVALALARCPIPTISAVGHEIDITIADLVADCRAPTPTAAAALVVPDQSELLADLSAAQLSMELGLKRILREQAERLRLMGDRLRDPRQSALQLRLRLDDLSDRALRAIHVHHQRTTQILSAFAHRLNALSPLAVLDRGFSITSRMDSGAIVHDGSTLNARDRLLVRFARGRALVQVIEGHASKKKTGESHDDP